MTWEGVRDTVRTMSLDDRLRLMDAIWEEISADPSLAELSPEFQEELDRRIASAEQSPEAGRAWRDVIRELKAQ